MAGLNRREEKRHRPPGVCPRFPRLHGLLSRVLGASGPPQGGGAGPGSCAFRNAASRSLSTGVRCLPAPRVPALWPRWLCLAASHAAQPHRDGRPVSPRPLAPAAPPPELPAPRLCTRSPRVRPRDCPGRLPPAPVPRAAAAPALSAVACLAGSFWTFWPPLAWSPVACDHSSLCPTMTWPALPQTLLAQEGGGGEKWSRFREDVRAGSRGAGSPAGRRCHPGRGGLTGRLKRVGRWPAGQGGRALLTVPQPAARSLREGSGAIFLPALWGHPWAGPLGSQAVGRGAQPSPACTQHPRLHIPITQTGSRLRSPAGSRPVGAGQQLWRGWGLPLPPAWPSGVSGSHPPSAP